MNFKLTYLSVSITNRSSGIKYESESKIGNTSRQIGFEQNILGFKIPMGHSRFAPIRLGSWHLFMKMGESSCHALRDSA